MMQGGPLMHAVAAKAVALKEAATPGVPAVRPQVIANAQALTAGLEAEGMRPVTGGTDTHLALLDLQGAGRHRRRGRGALRRRRHRAEQERDPVRPAAAERRLGHPGRHARRSPPRAWARREMDDDRLAHRPGRPRRGRLGRRGGRRRGRRAGHAPPGLPARLTARARVPALPARRRGGDLPGHPAGAPARAPRLGAMAEVRDRDVHDEPTPRWGGLAMFAGLLRRAAGGQPAAADALGLRGRLDRAVALLSGAAIIVALGVARRPVGPRRADQVRRAGARRRRHGAAGHRASLWLPIGGTLVLDPITVGPADRARSWS